MKTLLSKCQLPIAMIIVFHASTGAIASEPKVDLDGIDADANTTEIELDLRFVDNKNALDQQLQLQAEHTFDEMWSIGAELELEREAGQAITADSALARVKWRAPKSKSGFSFALQAGLGYSFSDNAALSETEAYLGWKRKGWSVVSRFDLEQVLQKGEEPEIGYRLRVARNVGSDITIGTEAAGDIWTGGSTKHRLGPYLEFPLGGDDAPSLELGAFAGLNSVSPDMVYRVEMEFDF